MAAMANIELSLSPELKAAFEELADLIKGLREDGGKTTEVRYEPARCRCPAQLHAHRTGGSLRGV